MLFYLILLIKTEFLYKSICIVERDECNIYSDISSFLYNLKTKNMKSFAHPRVNERGILTSAYKQEIKHNISDMKRKSLSRIKSSLFSRQDKLQSQTGTALQVSLFAIALVVILF